MPTPSPTAEQIETVREIAALYSFTQTKTLISVLNDAGWAATLSDITEWNRVKNKHTRLNGDGVIINKEENRLDITVRVRRRLGIFPAVPVSEAETGGGGSYCSYTPPIIDDQMCGD